MSVKPGQLHGFGCLVWMERNDEIESRQVDVLHRPRDAVDRGQSSLADCSLSQVSLDPAGQPGFPRFNDDRDPAEFL
ncbi:hypothetical protein [Actinopolymorpha rutila]|uniref:Uncharacterized protein n=1 Tax=Actinopolymorpha rutila TaxID=446787 RepID=A0A852ZLX0_9ACTN|nr:hypothetical protein [Actinopolymorpha rutila]NYH92868.1 hypothetical protein [Actinopolymorpha rutila]